jgi:hypothetical protein
LSSASRVTFQTTFGTLPVITGAVSIFDWLGTGVPGVIPNYFFFEPDFLEYDLCLIFDKASDTITDKKRIIMLSFIY